MLKRAAYEELLNWKASGAGKALLVEGPRQVGKTYLIKAFAEREYDDYVLIDFVEDGDAARQFASVNSAESVIQLVSLKAGRRLEPGRTLLFFDEVQRAPEIVTFSKYLVEDGRFDVVMSGSMLGVELGGVKSWPVGYLRVVSMWPLTFREFCWANGVPWSVMESVRECYASKNPLDEGIHQVLVNLHRQFLVIGGMPEAVQKSIDTSGDLGAVREVQDDLTTLYREDIARYAQNRSVQVKAIYGSIPAQLSKENKRFKLQAVKSGAKYERYAHDFEWLVAARSAIKANRVIDPKPMLERSEQRERFKLYMSDTGMLLANYSASIAMGVIAGERSVNFGAVYENAVAQALAAAGSPVRYYNDNRKGEVDFLMETRDGKVLPIEVKSGKDYKVHTALNNLLGTQEYGIGHAVVLSEANLSVGERQGKPVYYLPLYMEGLVADEAATRASAKRELEGFHLDPVTFPNS